MSTPEDPRKYSMKRKQVPSEPRTLEELQDMLVPPEAPVPVLGVEQPPTPLQEEMQTKAHLCLHWVWGELGRDAPVSEVENLAYDLMGLPTDELEQLVRIFYSEGLPYRSWA